MTNTSYCAKANTEDGFLKGRDKVYHRGVHRLQVWDAQGKVGAGSALSQSRGRKPETGFLQGQDELPEAREAGSTELESSRRVEHTEEGRRGGQRSTNGPQEKIAESRDPEDCGFDTDD